MPEISFQFDEKYDGLPLILQQVETVADNKMVHEGDIVCTILLDGVDSIEDYLENGDLVQICGESGTGNKFYIAQFWIDGDTYILKPTSSYIHLPKTRFTKEEFFELDIRGKVIFTFRDFSGNAKAFGNFKQGKIK